MFALVPLRTSVLCVFTAKDEAIEVESSILITCTYTFFFKKKTHKNCSYLKKKKIPKSLWMCATLSICLWSIIFLSTRIHLFSAALLKPPTKPWLWLEQTMWLVVFTFFCCFSPYSLHDCLCITQIACFLQSSSTIMSSNPLI